VGAFCRGAQTFLAALLGTSGDVPKLEGEGGLEDFSSRVQAVVKYSITRQIVLLLQSFYSTNQLPVIIYTSSSKGLVKETRITPRRINSVVKRESRR